MSFKKGYILTPEMKQKRVEAQRRAWAERKALREESGDYDKFSLDNRPYFTPLPDGWENQKHLNVPQEGHFFSDVEYSLFNLGAKLEKAGVFLAEPQEKKTKVVQTTTGFNLVRGAPEEMPEEA